MALTIVERISYRCSVVEDYGGRRCVMGEKEKRRRRSSGDRWETDDGMMQIKTAERFDCRDAGNEFNSGVIFW